MCIRDTKSKTLNCKNCEQNRKNDINARKIFDFPHEKAGMAKATFRIYTNSKGGGKRGGGES